MGLIDGPTCSNLTLNSEAQQKLAIMVLSVILVYVLCLQFRSCKHKISCVYIACQLALSGHDANA